MLVFFMMKGYPRILISGPLASIYQKASILVMEQSLQEYSSKHEQNREKDVTRKQQDQPERDQVSTSHVQAERPGDGAASRRPAQGEQHNSIVRAGQQGILSTEQQGILKELGKRVTQLKLLARVQSVLAYAQTLLAVEPKVWDANPWLLGTKRGVIDLRTGTLRPGRPDDYIRTVIPTEWKGLDEPAPRFMKFLHEIFADRAEDEREELIAFLQRTLGYGLTGNVNEHIFLMLYGEEGRNGKDTLMHALEYVLGSAVGAVSQDVLIAGGRYATPGNAKPHLCSLQGKRIAWASEPSEHARFAVNQVKLLTGGGDIVARQLYGKEFTFQPSHLLVLLSNHKPEADAADRAFWERLCPIVFNQRFVSHPERANEQLRDPGLARDLEAEASGILAWLVRGTLEWHRIGLAIPESVRRARREYRSGESTIESFAADCCTLDPEAQTPAGALYKAYRAWASENGFTPVSNKQFGLEIKGIDGVSGQRTRTTRVYQGIALQRTEES